MQKVAFYFTVGLAFVIPWEAFVVFSGFGTITRLVGIGATLFGILAALEQQRTRPLGRVFAVLVVITMYVFFSYFWTVDPAKTGRRILTYSQLLVMVFIIGQYADSKGKTDLLIQAYVLGALIISYDIFHNYLQGEVYRNELAPRYSAARFNPNRSALNVTLAIPMAWYLSTIREEKFWIWVNRFAIVPFVTVELLTASRGGLVAMLAPLPILLWGYSKSTGSQKATGLFLAVLAVLVVSIVVPSSTWDRLSELGHLSNSDLGERQGIWDAGFQVWEQQYGLFGTGAGGYYEATYDYFEEGGHTAHNVFVSILTELGFIGFLIFAVLGINIVREVKQLPFQQRVLSYAMLAVWGFHSLSSGNEYAKTTWFLIGLLMTMTVNYQNAVMAEKPVIKTQLPILPVQSLYPPQYHSIRGQHND